MKKELSLYIHIPFCNSKCNYCSFISKVANNEEKAKYIECLKKEIKIQATQYNKFYSVRTIFIGGGTPSCLERGSIKDIMTTIYRYFTVRNDAEITIEINPNSVTPEKINEYVISGVNRFSIGLQCSDQKVLLNMGRTHTTKDFDDAIKMIRDNGISNINADVILGYPDQSLDAVTKTVNHLVNLKIPHISSYMLSVEEGTPLQTMIDKGVKYLPSETLVLNMYHKVTELLNKAGYMKYELSNFAKPGFMCKHNLVYWKREDYLGFGAAAHSYINGTRFSNTENVYKYMDCLNTLNKPPVAVAKHLTAEEKKEEFVMLSLRTAEGLNLEEYEKEFGKNFLLEHKDVLSQFIKMKFLVLTKDGYIKATSQGFLVLNKIILEICTN